jgi:hypothetical protein
MQGTYEFLACEVATGWWDFAPSRPADKKKLQAAKMRNARGRTDSRRVTFTPFTFNPIHDIESLWWLAVWSLSRHVPAGSQVLPEQSRTFEGPIDHLPNRVSFLREYNVQDRWTESLPLDLKNLAGIVCEWSAFIVASHRLAEANLEKSIDSAAYQDTAAPQSAVEALTIEFDEDIRLRVAQFTRWHVSLFVPLQLVPLTSGSLYRVSKRSSTEADIDIDLLNKRPRHEIDLGDVIPMTKK